MKKHALVFLLFFAFTISNFCNAQSDKRYTLDIKISLHGKNLLLPLSSFSYSVTRDNADTSAMKENAYPKYFYVNIIPVKLTKEFLELMADKNATFEALVTKIDSYGKMPTKETILKNAKLYSLSESSSTYDYDTQGGTSNISINAGSLVIEGVEIFP